MNKQEQKEELADELLNTMEEFDGEDSELNLLDISEVVLDVGTMMVKSTNELADIEEEWVSDEQR